MGWPPTLQLLGLAHVAQVAHAQSRWVQLLLLLLKARLKLLLLLLRCQRLKVGEVQIFQVEIFVETDRPKISVNVTEAIVGIRDRHLHQGDGVMVYSIQIGWFWRL